jgi:hypothetical protein
MGVYNFHIPTETGSNHARDIFLLYIIQLVADLDAGHLSCVGVCGHVQGFANYTHVEVILYNSTI